MTLRDALKEICISSSCSDADFETEFNPEMLDAEFIEQEDDLQLDDESTLENIRYCSLPAELESEILDAVRIVRENPAMRVIGLSIYRSVFLCQNAEPWAWRPLANVMHGKAGLFYLAVAAGFVPRMKKLHARLGIAEEITKNTCYQVCAYCHNHFAGTGYYGIYPRQLSWLHNYLDPDHFMVRLGRFEFRLMEHYYDGHVYRHRKTGELVIFAITGLAFDINGFAVESTPDSPERAFESIYREENGFATGNTVDPYGRTAAEPTTIDLAEYDLVLKKGMPILDMHIPSGGGMTPAETEKSFRMAKEFYFAHFDEAHRPVAVVCSSWIFNPNLPEILDPESNLVRLLKRVHPVPRNSKPTDGLWFIFRHEGAFELLKAPRKTSLQRAVTKFIENGGRWRTGGLILMMDEI